MGPKHTEHPVQVGAFSGCCFGTGQSWKRQLLPELSEKHPLRGYVVHAEGSGSPWYTYVETRA